MKDRALRALTERRRDRDLCAWSSIGDSHILNVVFSGIGKRSDLGKPDFVRSAQLSGRAHVLYIADPQRSWLNRPGLIEDVTQMIIAEQERLAARRVFLMGASLGGYMAIAMSGWVRADRVLAFSPQIVVNPVLVPGEKRWNLLRGRIRDFRIQNVFDVSSRIVPHVVVFGDAVEEQVQISFLPREDNLNLTLLAGVGHNSASHLKVRADLCEVVETALLAPVHNVNSYLTRIARMQPIGA